MAGLSPWQYILSHTELTRKQVLQVFLVECSQTAACSIITMISIGAVRDAVQGNLLLQERGYYTPLVFFCPTIFKRKIETVVLPISRRSISISHEVLVCSMLLAFVVKGESWVMFLICWLSTGSSGNSLGLDCVVSGSFLAEGNFLGSLYSESHGELRPPTKRVMREKTVVSFDNSKGRYASDCQTAWYTFVMNAQ